MKCRIFGSVLTLSTWTMRKIVINSLSRNQNFPLGQIPNDKVETKQTQLSWNMVYLISKVCDWDFLLFVQPSFFLLYKRLLFSMDGKTPLEIGNHQVPVVLHEASREFLGLMWVSMVLSCALVWSICRQSALILSQRCHSRPLGLKCFHLKFQDF